ncbi:MAG: hypothetical protein H7330_08275 [Hymenobacteraceae bacterium]|nr:hypothetical protein [Hymenobacteraceae bacterium]
MTSSSTPTPFSRTLRPATDTEMRQLIYDHPYVLAVYVSTTCDPCDALVPSFERLAHERRFAHIQFLQLDAADSVVPVREIAANQAPFVSVYHHGRIVYCGTVYKKKEVADLLLQYYPAAD